MINWSFQLIYLFKVSAVDIAIGFNAIQKNKWKKFIKMAKFYVNIHIFSNLLILCEHGHFSPVLIWFYFTN